MRPIYMGLIFFLVGVIGYLGVSVYYDLMSLQTALIYVFIAIAVASLPVAIILEIIRWRKGKTEQKKQTS
jgi:quinol-cytochrome oxidoreductase complex cytochrome b subunit